jgi:cytochrome c2
MKSSMVILGMGILAFFGAALVFSRDGGTDQGLEVYAIQKCALCHSISGVGGKKLALDHVGAKLNAGEIRKWIKTPKAMKPDTIMKSYPNLPEKDLADLTAFLLTLR